MKILVAYDDDRLSSKVIDHALQRAKDSAGSVFLVHSFGTKTKEETFVAWEKQLNQIQKEVFERNGIPCESHILVRGLSPGEDIVNYALQKKIDEIIIGIEKRSKVGKMVFGSTARHIILESHCPVLTIK